MKKLLFLLAVAGLISFAACKSGETKVEATADSTDQIEAPVRYSCCNACRYRSCTIIFPA